MAIAACMLAGMCTFLNVYQHAAAASLPTAAVSHIRNRGASFTVSATILAVALTAPLIGLLAESIGRKKVIVPSLYAITVPTLLAATSHSLHQLIFWRFMQGLFVPGVIVVIMAYIGEEFAGHLLDAPWLRTFPGRCSADLEDDISRASSPITSVERCVCCDWHCESGGRHHGATLAAGGQELCPRGGGSPFHLSYQTASLDYPRLLAVFGMGFAALFCLVGTFTYANFYLADAPYHLNSAQLGSIFFVYLFGLIVTPLSGRCLDHYGIRVTSAAGFGFAAVGLLLTLVHSLPVIIVGLALASSGVFIYQAVGTVQTGVVAGKARSSAAGLYVTFYYIGGSLGATVTGWTWVAGGWPPCVFLMMGVAGMAVVMAFASSGKTVISSQPSAVV